MIESLSNYGRMTLVEKNYYGIRVIAWCSDQSWHPCPWSFAIQKKDGNWIRYYGIRNRCETRRSALTRARYRAKWLADETYDEHYN